jgi:hypothetical protein
MPALERDRGCLRSERSHRASCHSDHDWGRFLSMSAPKSRLAGHGLAEREGFEPPIPLRVCRISSAVLSTTQPPLRSPKRAKKGREWTGAM